MSERDFFIGFLSDLVDEKTQGLERYAQKNYAVQIKIDEMKDEIRGLDEVANYISDLPPETEMLRQARKAYKDYDGLNVLIPYKLNAKPERCAYLNLLAV